MSPAATGLTTTLIILAVLVPIDVWVFRDASAHARRGHPVVARLGTLVVETPQQWALGCVVLLVAFLPLYLVAREGAP